MLKKQLLGFLLLLVVGYSTLFSQNYTISEEQLQQIESSIEELESYKQNLIIVKNELSQSKEELKKLQTIYEQLLNKYEKTKKWNNYFTSSLVGIVSGIVIWRVLK